MSVLCYCLVGTRFQVDDVSACCEVGVGTRCKGGDVGGLMEYLEAT